MKESQNRMVLHLDMDAFFVSVEVLRDGRLKGKPLIIGGRNGRGVVAACSYETRLFGVHSAMPMKMALQRCPAAIVLTGDMEAYTRFSTMVTQIIRSTAPVFEKSSIDEFYLDLTGMDKYFGVFKWSAELRKKITKETRLPISMGLSVNKLVSKVATNEAKPNGQLYVPRGNEQNFLAPMHISKIPMIGKKTVEFLGNMGITHVKTLRQMPVEMLTAALGINGKKLWNKAHGIDESPVVPYREQKSISTETTFGSDTSDIKMIRSILTAMIEKLAFKLRKERKLASCVAIKIRYSNFETVSRQVHIAYTASDRALIAYALELFDRLYTRHLLIRLVGVRLSSLVHGGYQINLFDDTVEEIRLSKAMDQLKDRFGAEAVIRASTLTTNSRIRHD